MTDTDAFVLPGGCRVSVREAPTGLGPGVLLHYRMTTPGDDREAEVYLPWEYVAQLADILNAHLPPSWQAIGLAERGGP